MARTARPTEGIDPATFATAVAAAVDQILAARTRPTANVTDTHFAISPALAQPNGLDYSSATGAKIFTKATEPLKTCFNIKSPNIRILLNEIQTRSESFGWNALFNINISNDGDLPVIRNLLTTHGQCNINSIQRESTSYMNTMTRKRQNNYQLFVCLTNSVDDHTKRILANEEQTYMSTGHPCGVTYFKMLIQKAEVDTRATASHIRRLLTQLDIYMVKDAKHNINTFNEYVNDQMNSLASRGETSNDILVNLIRGYLACSDKKFVEYIEKCKDSYEEGENMTYQSLMAKAERKYQARVMNGEWNLPTQEQEEIIALKAKLASWNQSKPRKESMQVQVHKNQKKDGRKFDTSKTKGAFKGQQSWRNYKPQAHESTVKVVNGSTWHFCTHHQAWGRHPTDKCLKGKMENNRVSLEASLAHIGIRDIVDNSE